MERCDAVIEAVTMPASRPVLRLADPISRLKAVILDGLIVAVVYLGIAFIAQSLDWQVQGLRLVPVDDPTIADVAWTLALYLMINLAPMQATGQTWGKRWQGIAVIDADKSKATLTRQLMRYFVQQLSSFLPLLNLLNALLIFRKDRRCGHDHIVGTRVIEYP